MSRPLFPASATASHCPVYLGLVAIALSVLGEIERFWGLGATPILRDGRGVKLSGQIQVNAIRAGGAGT
jgi:hypothetical protein